MENGCNSPSDSGMVLIQKTNVGIQASAGNPHAAFVVAGVGNGLLSTAPTFDPTRESLGERFPWATSTGGWGRKTPGYQILFRFYDLGVKEPFRYLCTILEISV